MSIKEATPQNRPNYFLEDMAVRGAVGDLAGNSQVHLLGFRISTQTDFGQTEARTDNSNHPKVAIQLFKQTLLFPQRSYLVISQ